MNMQPKTLTAAPMNWGALLRAVLSPSLIWASVSLFVIYQGQPGVMCLTPMAWLLSIWGGVYYGQHEHPSRPAVFGGLIAGAITGIVMAALFVYGSARMMIGETRPDEIARGNTMTVAIGIASIIVCALVTALSAHMAQRRQRSR